MIQHTVVFTLKHPAGSPQEKDFLEAAMILEQIPPVRNFQRNRQVSTKNNFSFGFSMAFETEAAYQEYNDHPIHTEFVETRWIPEVTEFMEIDYAPYNKPK